MALTAGQMLRATGPDECESVDQATALATLGISGVPVPSTRNINTTNGVTGGGDLTADRTIQLSNMADSTVKGRAAGSGTGVPADLTTAQLTALVDDFVGDSGSGGTSGGVPAPAAGDAAANKFLKADGTWAVAGTGSVTDVTATSPLASSGGTTPDISLTGIVPVANGGTSRAALTSGALLIGDGTSQVQLVGPGGSGAIAISNGLTFTMKTVSVDASLSSAGALTIANDAVTYAKMQNVSAASKLLGRGDSGAGDPQEITLGTGLSMSGTTLSATATGDVVGPGSATDNAIARFDGTTGKLIQNSGVTIDDTGTLQASGRIISDTALEILSSANNEYLQIKTTNNNGVSRDLTINTDDNRTLAVNGNTTLAGGTHSGTNTGDQTITLTGDVTGSGTGSFATTLATVTVSKGGTGQTSLTSGAFVTGNGTGAVSLVGPGSAGQIPVSSGSAPVMTTVSGDASLTSAGVLTVGRNRLVNGDFAVGQRGTSFTSTTTPANSDDTYHLDRWYTLSDGNDVVDITRDSSTVPTNGTYAIALDVETVNKKFGIAQIVEWQNCKGLIGNTVTLSFKAKVSSTTKLDNIKCAIVAWSGTADSVTSDIISAWNVEGTNPTLIANATYENTPANLNVTTSYATYSVSAAVDTASTKNVIVFIWSDVTDTTLGDFLYITDVQLEKGASATNFEYIPIETTIDRCKRYCRVFGNGGQLFERLGVAQCISTTQARGMVQLSPQMRITPSAISSSDMTKFFVTNASGSAQALAASTGIAINAVGCAPWALNLTYTVGSGTPLVAGNATEVGKNNDATVTLIVDTEL